MNKERVRKVRNMLAEHATDRGCGDGRLGCFDMMSFGFELGLSVRAQMDLGLDVDDALAAYECDTAACAAGWAWVCYQVDAVAGETADIDADIADAAAHRKTHEVAAVYMGLPPRDMAKIAFSFPKKVLDIGPHRVGHTIGPSREWTVAMLDGLLATGKVDWQSSKPETTRRAWGPYAA